MRTFRCIYALQICVLLIFSLTPLGMVSASHAALPSFQQEDGETIDWDIEGQSFHVYIINSSGKKTLAYTGDAGEMNSALLRLSPDGQKILYVTARDLGFLDSSIWIIDRQGQGRQQLLSSGEGYWVTNPIWSPDGQQFAYIKVLLGENGWEAGMELWTYQLADGSSKQVMQAQDFHPLIFVGSSPSVEWRSDGQIRYVEEKGNEKLIFLVDPQTGTVLFTEKEQELKVLTVGEDCQGMVKPVNVRTYDGIPGNGYTTAYLDKYVYTTHDGYGSHPGVDISGGSGSVNSGTTIVASGPGTVVTSGAVNGWGNIVIIKHSGSNCGGNVYSIYAHMQSRPTVTGTISVRTELGKVGCTTTATGGTGGATCTGPHLHFQVDKDNTSHPFWPSINVPTRSGQCNTNSSCTVYDSRNIVNNPDSDNQVKDRTVSPMRFVQDHAGSGGGGTTTNCDDGEGAVLYEHENYTGRCTRFTGDDDNLSDNTIGNDTASSIKIIGNYEATVYENPGYGGANTSFTGSDPLFTNDAVGNDRPSSIRVRRRDAGGSSNCDGGTGAYLYENTNYGGKCSKFTGDSDNPNGWFVGNDAVSSIRFVGNYETTVYEHGGYQGASTNFTSDDPDLSNDSVGNDRASSIRVRQRQTGGTSNCDNSNGVQVYEHPNYQGRCSKFTSDSPSPNGWYVGNDSVSSIRFFGNYEAILYQHDNYNGVSATFTADNLDLGGTAIGHDQASSIRVHTRNSNPPGPTSCSANQFLAEYYNNRNLSGSPLYRGCEGGGIHFNWQGGGPGSGIGNDNFSIRWSGIFWFDEGTYKITTRTDDGLRLWFDNNPIINEWRDMGATSFLHTRNVSAGNHTIKMEYYENGGAAVADLSWTKTQSTATDPDDNKTIGYGTGSDGNISPAGDVDDYYFEGSSGQSITIRMDKRNSELDSFVDLYGPDGRLVGQDDDSGGNRNARLAVTLNQNGRFKIRAHAYSTSQTGGYRLSLDNQSASGTDPDDGRWIAFGNSLNGTITPSTDRDTYYFSGTAGRVIAIRMNKVDSGLDPFLELYNPSGVKVAENDDGGGNQNSLLAYSLTVNGTYRIVARSYSTASSGRYTLALYQGENTSGNLARGKSVSATSVEFNGVEAAKAVDGNTSTRWASRFSDPQQFTVDLGSDKTFNQVVIKWEAAYARKYGIYYWTGTQWRNVYWTDNGDGGTDTITFDSVIARKVALYGTQRATSYGYSFWEFEVYNSLDVLFPLVMPDPDDKEPESGVDVLIPLAPSDPDKGEVILLGEADTGQENMPLPSDDPEILIGDTVTGMPDAFIFYPSADQNIYGVNEEILFQGTGTDNDEEGESITAYEWKIDDNLVGSADVFSLPSLSLSEGTHTVSFRVQDNEGNWSTWQTVDIQVFNPWLTFIPLMSK